MLIAVEGAHIDETEAMGRVTLQTIADQLGVSRMTVSNAFSKPDQLSADLRQRVLDAAMKLGYAGPDPAARVLARGKTGTVGVLLTESLQYAFADEVAASLFAALADELGAAGLALTLFTSSGKRGFAEADQVPMDAAIVYSCEYDLAAVQNLTRRGIPLVFVDQPPAKGVWSVNVDDIGGARLGAEHVIALGHRRIALVLPTPRGPAGLVDRADMSFEGHADLERTRGWLDALDKASIVPQIFQAEKSFEEIGSEAASVLLALRAPDRPTAVLCFSDTIAFGFVQQATAMSYVVPTDVSVVGFDDSALARRMQPALTTVRQDTQAKGRIAGEAVIELLKAPDAKRRPRNVVLPTSLIVRSTTTHPRRTRHR